MKQKIVLLLVVLAMAGLSRAEEYYLLKEDTPTYRSFLTNPGNGYGWSSLEDPEPGNTYVVKDGYWNLYTPAGADGETLSFKGDKLILKTGYLIVSAGNLAGDKTVWVDDLEINYGAIQTSASFSGFTFRVGGKVTFDASTFNYIVGASTIKARAADILRLEAKVVASARDTLVYSGEAALSGRVSDAFDSHGNKQFTWKRYYDKMQTHVLGDNTGNLATNRVQCGVGFYVGCATMPGPIMLNNASLLSVDDSVAEACVSTVFARDGYVRIPAGKSLNAAGHDFAFAEPSTYMLNGVNCYTGLPSDEPYAPVHVCPHAYGETCYLNVIELGSNAGISAPKAELRGTLVALGADSALTVGDATLSDVVLSGKGVLNVTNSLSISGKVLVQVDTAVRETVCLTLPVGKGALNAEDFTVQDGINPFRYRLYVKVVDGVQQLRCRNVDLGANTSYSAATGYVTVTAAGGSGSLDQATNWSDGQIPHSSTNYYVGYNGRAFNCGSGGVFKGDSLTMGRYRFDQGYTYIRAPDRTASTTISDLILLPYCTEIVAWGDRCETTFYGKMTVLTTASLPFVFRGEQSGQAFVLNNEVEGWTNAVLLAEMRTVSSVSAGAGQPRLDFVGTNRNYFGCLKVGTNEIVRIGGDGFPNARVELTTAYAITKTYPTAGKTYPVKCLALTDSAGYVEVVEDTSLEVGSLALSGRLEKSGTGRLVVTGPAEAGTGAELKMNAGTLQVTSSSALSGTVLTIAEGAVLAVKYPDGAIAAAEAATLPSTLNVVVEADAKALVADKPTIPFLTIPTPETDPVFKFNKPVKGYKFVVQKSVSGGLTTYSAHFDSFGLAIIVR